MEEMNGKITEQLKQAIRETELPVMEIARQAGISQGQLSRFMRDHRTLTLPVVEKLCALLGLELRRAGPAKRHGLLKPPLGRSNVDTTKYAVEISDDIVKPCTFKNHALFAVVQYLCNDRLPRVSPEEIQSASGMTENEKKLFQVIRRRVSSDEFVAEASAKNANWVRESNWWCKEGELIYTQGKTYAFNKEWGHKFHTARENLMRHFPEVQINPCP